MPAVRSSTPPFAEHAGAPEDNNAAERAIHPFVTGREVRGGARIPNGSDAQAILLGRLQTWAPRGRDTLDACKLMLAGRTATTAAASAHQLHSHTA